MVYKTELHCHTYPASDCSHISPEEMAEHYAERGYHTVVLTNHLKRRSTDDESSWKERVAQLMSDYHRLKRAANGRFHVLLGAEMRPDGRGTSDYLVFGVTEQILLDSFMFLPCKFDQFSAALHGAGCMIYQAHPFRNGMMVTDPTLLDGIEVYNPTPRALSRNAFAALWAEHFGLKKIAGSDFHARQNKEFPNGERASCAILTDTPITCNEELLCILQSERYGLLCQESAN